jgi:hypothetical protein
VDRTARGIQAKAEHSQVLPAPVQLPLELSDALLRVAQRSGLMQLIDDLVHFVVNYAGAFFPGVLHKD